MEMSFLLLPLVGGVARFHKRVDLQPFNTSDDPEQQRDNEHGSLFIFIFLKRYSAVPLILGEIELTRTATSGWFYFFRSALSWGNGKYLGTPTSLPD